MKRFRFPAMFAIMATLVLIAAGCDEVRDANGDDAGPGDEPTATATPAPDPAPEPTPEPTPTEEPDDPAVFEYELIHTEKSLPPDTWEPVIDVAFTEDEFQRRWERFQIEEAAPDVDWDRWIVIFAGTGESGTCPLELMDVTYDQDASRVSVEVDPNLPPDAVCTDDWTPRVFVIGIAADAVDQGNLTIRFAHGDHASGEVIEFDAGWYDVIHTEKVLPDEELGDNVYRLVEDPDEFAETWEWFNFEEELPDVDWDSHVVLFVGTGESGTCPLHVDQVRFNDEDRRIEVMVAMEDPGAICTMDWTPRAFVIALDPEVLGEGDLRAIVMHSQFKDEVRPEDGEVIR
jgi:hypothetical protein